MRSITRCCKSNFNLFLFSKKILCIHEDMKLNSIYNFDCQNFIHINMSVFCSVKIKFLCMYYSVFLIIFSKFVSIFNNLCIKRLYSRFKKVNCRNIRYSKNVVSNIRTYLCIMVLYMIFLLLLMFFYNISGCNIGFVMHYPLYYCFDESGFLWVHEILQSPIKDV